MTEGKTPNQLMVFFTYGNSVQTWADSGILSREVMLYKKMIAQGIRVSFLTYGDNTDFEYENALEGIEIIPVYSVFKKSRNKWINYFRSLFIPFSKKLKIVFKSSDIYKTNQMSGSWVAVLAAILFKKKLVVRCGFEMLRNLIRDEKNLLAKSLKAILAYPLELLTYTRADRIIISNASDLDFVSRAFPVRKQKIRLNRNFIDTDLFSRQPNKNNKGSSSALFIGRIETCKNIMNLVKAASLSGCRLDIIGKGTKENEIKSYLEKYHCGVRLLGRIDNFKLPQLIQKYDLFVLPSFFECSPKSLLEAMACESVVLGTDVDGIRELISHDKSGFLCETDAVSIANSIRQILNTDNVTLERIRKKARQFVVRECSAKRVLDREMAVYSELLS